MINSHINKIDFFKALIIFIVINVFFCYGQFWKQIVNDQSRFGAIPGELMVSEWISETVYQRTINGLNPFDNSKTVLYPFGITLANLEPGFGLFFLFLRPFFSTHESMSIIIALNMLLANIGMYLLLKKLKISSLVSFLIALSYGYSTYLMPRTGGHVTYTSIYLFPWFFYFCHQLFFNTDRKFRLIGSLGAAITISLALFINMYFAIILGLATFIVMLTNFFFNRKNVFTTIANSWKYLILTLILTIGFLTPWLIAVYKLSKFSQLGNVKGWAGAIEFSSDLFGFFIPSQYARYYGQFIGPLTKNIEFSHGIFENFSYPGIIVFLSLLLIVINYRSLTQKLRIKLLPFISGSILFFILVLGPFLHVAGRWSLLVDDGIRIVFPLPFVLLHYFPLLNNIRSPGRLAIGFVFFSCILGAYIFNYYSAKISSRGRILIGILLFFIIILDQRFDDRGTYPVIKFPNKLYNTIAKDSATSTLMEIPFVVRDGFTYFGDYNSVQNVTGQLKHGKPIIGGYYGRIPDYYKQYYLDNPLFGYIGREIDGAKQLNVTVKDSLLEWKKIDLSTSTDVLDFLNIKYVILDENISSSKKMIELLKNFKFSNIERENDYSLWQRIPSDREFLKIDMGDKSSATYLGMGWYEPELDNFRWSSKKSTLMFKLKHERKMKLKLIIEPFVKPQYVDIFLNEHKIDRIFIDSSHREYLSEIDKYLVTGINTFEFIADRSFKPSEVMYNSLDQREISIKFVSAELVEN